MYMYLNLCGLEKIPNEFKLMNQVLVFVLVIKDVCCAAISPWKKNTLKKSLKAPNYHNINAHDDLSDS